MWGVGTALERGSASRGLLAQAWDLPASVSSSCWPPRSALASSLPALVSSSCWPGNTATWIATTSWPARRLL